MEALFNESDFDLIAQYAGKKQKDVPEPYDKLKAVYDKLGHIMAGLKGLGYHTDIKRHPLFSGNGYAPYHWGRVYPKQQALQEECHDKVFFVVGTDAMVSIFILIVTLLKDIPVMIQRLRKR